MPELPEVETTRRGLTPLLVGHTIASACVHSPRLRWPVPRDLPARVRGRRVRDIMRRGKYLLFDLESGWLLVHLGMSGSLRVLAAPTPPGPHDHVELRFEGGQTLRLRDPRRFGAVLWAGAAPWAHPLLAPLGVEPLGAGFDGDYLFRATRGRRAAIKQVLMDGRVVVGIGNIYAAETLFLAGVNPRTVAGSLSRARCARIAEAARNTLARAIEAGGASLRDFVGVDGTPGYFQLDTWVYDREGLPCRRCGTAIRRILQAQRSTCYCPRCQR